MNNDDILSILKTNKHLLDYHKFHKNCIDKVSRRYRREHWLLFPICQTEERLEIWGKAKRESAWRPKSNWEENSGG